MSYHDPKAIARDYAAAIDERCRVSADCVALYADALRTYGPDGLDWKQVNGAILRRWAPSTLNAIKKKAWKEVRA